MSQFVDIIIIRKTNKIEFIIKKTNKVMTSHEKSLEDWIFRVVGGVAVLIMVASNLPQIMHIFRTKRSDDVNIYGLLMRFAASIMVLVYAFYFNLWEIFIPNAINLILTTVLLIMKKCYDTDFGILDKQLIVDEMGNVKVDKSTRSDSPMDLDFNLDDGLKEHPYNDEDEYKSFRIPSDEIINSPIERL